MYLDDFDIQGAFVVKYKCTTRTPKGQQQLFNCRIMIPGDISSKYIQWIDYSFLSMWKWQISDAF